MARCLEEFANPQMRHWFLEQLLPASDLFRGQLKKHIREKGCARLDPLWGIWWVNGASTPICNYLLHL